MPMVRYSLKRGIYSLRLLSIITKISRFFGISLCKLLISMLMEIFCIIISCNCLQKYKKNITLREI